MGLMKPITTSVSTFSNLIEGGFVYVDKTRLIRELVRPAFAQYFLARPRRFGKSLLVSTLKALFQGRRDLFKGLAIDSSDHDWKTCPVIHLDMGSTQRDTAEEEAVFETDRDVYVVEFKRDEPAAAALAQIRAKDYAARVSLRGKPVTLLGVSFDSARRTVAEWKAEPANPAPS